MLKFTDTGLVAAPTTLQVRVGRTFAGRVRAGAPEPLRALTDAEVLDNVRWFTEGQRGPRARPCDGLVLSGPSPARYAALPSIVDRARSWGIRRVVIHAAGPPESAWLGRVDGVAIVVREPHDVTLISTWEGVYRSVVVVMEGGQAAKTEHLLRALIRLSPERVVLTWPLHADADPAQPHDVLPLIGLARRLCEAQQIELCIKGIPPCMVGPHGDLAQRTRNRWYVDAQHQRAAALLFLPGVTKFEQLDVCRFCRHQRSCDGLPWQWDRDRWRGRVSPVPRS